MVINYLLDVYQIIILSFTLGLFTPGCPPFTGASSIVSFIVLQLIYVETSKTIILVVVHYTPESVVFNAELIIA